MHRLLLALTALFLLSGCVSQPVDDRDRLTGTWAIFAIDKTEWEISPESEALIILTSRIVFSPQRMVFEDGGTVLSDYPYVTNQSKIPARIIFKKSNEESAYGIYKFLGKDSLLFCLNQTSVGGFPSEFKSVERKGIICFTLKRRPE